MDAVLDKYNLLKKNWKAKNLDQVGAILEELKVGLTTISFLPTNKVTKSNEKALLLAREALEIGAEHSVEVRDVPAFKRYMAMLKTYYIDYDSVLNLESPKKYELLGLNLLCLLSENLTPQFHQELELLPADKLLDNPYIACPVRLEQFITEGSYNKVKMV